MSDVPVVAVEEAKPVEVTETPAIPAAEEPVKTEDIPAVTETPAAAVEETPATQETPVEEKKDEKLPETEKRPKSPGFLAKLFKIDRKVKAPKSPVKKDKKNDEAETPVAEEAPKPEEVPVPAVVEATPEPAKEVLEPVKETETPAVETPAVDEAPKEEKKEYKGSKFTRRLSARVGDIFRKAKPEAPSTARVDELPPKIDEPTPVAPLENPATDTAPAETSAEPSESAKPVEPVPTAVAAAA